METGTLAGALIPSYCAQQAPVHSCCMGWARGAWGRDELFILHSPVSPVFPEVEDPPHSQIHSPYCPTGNRDFSPTLAAAVATADAC